ncbi:phage minor head protein [Fundidesulfovibrio butyratiphilus]
MPAPPDLAFAIGLPPERAIAYFKAKGYEITFDWHELQAGAQAKAFTVAKCVKLDVLKDIRDALQKALDEGSTLRQFQKDLTPTLKAKGWWGKQEAVDPRTGEVRTVQLGSPWRLKTIFETNMATAYAASRYQEQIENAEDQPYWTYVAVMDARTRPAHAALNGKTLRYDDPFWSSFYPPNGWNCRCRVRALSGERVERKGIKVESSKGRVTHEDVPVSRDGRTARMAIYNDGDVRMQTDPGWAYNPGKGWLNRKLTASLDAAPRDAANYALREMMRSDGFKRFLQKPEGDWPVMRLSKQAARAIKAKTEVAVLSSESAAKNIDHHPELTPQDYQRLPEIGAKPDLVIQVDGRKMVLARKETRWFMAAVKADASGENVYVTSFRKTNEKDVASLKRRGKVLWESWESWVE